MTLDANGIEILIGDTVRRVNRLQTFKVRHVLDDGYIYITDSTHHTTYVNPMHYEVVSLEDPTTFIKRLPV